MHLQALRRGPVEPLEQVAVGRDVEVLGDPHGGVARAGGTRPRCGRRAGPGPRWRRRGEASGRSTPSALREHGIDRSGKVLGALSPAVWGGAIDRQAWDQVRSVLLNPDRLMTLAPTRYLLTGLIFCGVCAGRMQARRRDARAR